MANKQYTKEELEKKVKKWNRIVVSSLVCTFAGFGLLISTLFVKHPQESEIYRNHMNAKITLGYLEKAKNFYGTENVRTALDTLITHMGADISEMEADPNFIQYQKESRISARHATPLAGGGLLLASLGIGGLITSIGKAKYRDKPKGI